MAMTNMPCVCAHHCSGIAFSGSQPATSIVMNLTNSPVTLAAGRSRGHSYSLLPHVVRVMDVRYNCLQKPPSGRKMSAGSQDL
eukprot:scaffold396778_cov17-Prasinocladus_malaysianus.AAC.3